jgi:hypothetical protein
MVRKTLKTLVVALIAAFALTSMAEAAAPKKTRHRAKHSSRVSSGASATAGKKPAAKKKAASAKAGTRAKANGAAAKGALKKAPVKRRPTTKPR